MKFIEENNSNLLQLNEDCLRLIFNKLTIRDQFNLRTLNANLANVLSSIWCSKYENQIDFHEGNNFQQLQTYELFELFHILSNTTKTLSNLNEQICNTLFQQEKRLRFSKVTTLTICATYDSIIKRAIKFPQNIAEILPELKILKINNVNISLAHMSNLWQLKMLSLINVNILDCATKSVMEVLVYLPHLQHLTFLPTTTNDTTSYKLDSVVKCHALQTLELTANKLSFIAQDIAELANLKVLRVFCSEVTNLRFIIKKLNAISTKQIVAVTLKCQIDIRILRELKLLTSLRKFSWHSHLQVDYVDQALHWQAYDNKLTSVVLELLQSYHYLEYLDLSENSHLNDMHLRQIVRLVDLQQQRGRRLSVNMVKLSKSQNEVRSSNNANDAIPIEFLE